ncbi:MAG: hypothetical protein IKY23_08430 [Lachnospiraceae bacterium]|nr:hypothetical protein [Lachnospiraceae bacterium]
MKKLRIGLITVLMAAVMLTACKDGSQEKNTELAQAEKVDTSGFMKATLDELTIQYDPKVWGATDVGDSQGILRFDAFDNGVLGVSRSVEGMYQHPLDMVAMAKQIYSGYEGFEVLAEPTVLFVNGNEWYEWSYAYVQDGIKHVNLQRVYGKNYYAFSLSYVADEAGYSVNLQSAKDAMDTVEVQVPDNKDGEAKAKEFLVGEWDLGSSGYLVLNQDDTYTWYMSSDKDKANMHTGTYGCDVENTSLGFVEGEGVYLVLFPTVLMVEGQEGMTGSVKYDYGIMLKQETEGVYQMLNVNSFTIYDMVKQ